MNKIKISKISIKNFRSIKDSTICLKRETILLGKNNIGKTSLLDAFQAFNYGLKLSDINIDLLIKIMNNKSNHIAISPTDCLELSVTYEWENLQSDYWSLLSNISDKGETRVLIRYSIPNENYPELSKVDKVNELLELFTKQVWIGSVKDFNDKKQKLLPPNTKLSKYLPISKSNLEQVRSGELLMCPIMAFRYVDSGRTSSEDATASQFSTKVARTLTKDEKVEDVFSDTQSKVDKVVFNSLKPFQEELKDFAYPRDPENPLKAILTLDEWLASPKVRISQTFGKLDGFELPLSAQGLGYQNIYNIIARISAFFAKMDELDLHNPVFFAIEEPEAFTHPQLQHIFIQQIYRFINKSAKDLQVPYQLMIISHSPEIAISAFEMNFEIVIGRKQRKNTYFINWDSIGGENIKSREKLKKLIMNYNAELLFADKLIAYEGNAERLILTAIMRKKVQSLLTEKIAFIPVGTAFNSLKNAIDDLRFEKVLLITDIDYKRKKGTNDIDDSSNIMTTNGNLRYLESTNEYDKVKINKIDLTSIFSKKTEAVCKKHIFKPSNNIKEEENTYETHSNFMIVTQGYNREFSFLPRTLESALVFASQENFEKYKNAKLLNEGIDETLKSNPFDVNDILGKLLKQGKADFALNSLELILDGEFTVPQYLLRGLNWLADTEDAR